MATQAFTGYGDRAALDRVFQCDFFGCWRRAAEQERQHVREEERGVHGQAGFHLNVVRGSIRVSPTFALVPREGPFRRVESIALIQHEPRAQCRLS